ARRPPLYKPRIRYVAELPEPIVSKALSSEEKFRESFPTAELAVRVCRCSNPVSGGDGTCFWCGYPPTREHRVSGSKSNGLSEFRGTSTNPHLRVARKVA